MGPASRRRHFSCVKQNATLTTARDSRPETQGDGRGRAKDGIIAIVHFPIVARALWGRPSLGAGDPNIIHPSIHGTLGLE